MESSIKYGNRIRKFLPKFPQEVLEQWFYEHWSQIDDYAWLEYELLEFEKMLWTAKDVIESGIKDNQTVQIDHRHFENGHRYQRQERIIDHFELTGTWPIAPIFLENIHGKIKFPDGRLCTSPYHLIEGHHRAAIFWGYYDRKKVKSQHYAWIARIPET